MSPAGEASRSSPTPRSAPAGRGRRGRVGPGDGRGASRGLRGLAGRLRPVLLAAAVVWAGGPETVTAQDESPARQLVKATHEAEGVERSYRLVIPEAAPPDGRALVVMLHGCTQDADDFATGTRMDRYALRQGFLVLYPEQPASIHPQRCWRWYEEIHQRREAGEAAQLVAMIRHVMEGHSVDPGRVYVAGMSAGGAMAVVLAATHPEKFAAAASHSGVAYGAARSQEEALAVMAGEVPSADTLARRLEAAMETAGADSLPPLQVIHGYDDQAVDVSNYRATAEAWVTADRWANDPSARDSARNISIHGDVGIPEEFAYGEDLWQRDGRPFVKARGITGLGHAWSGGDPAGSYTDPEGPNATETVLTFFARSADDEALDPEGSAIDGGENAEPGARGDTTRAGGP